MVASIAHKFVVGDELPKVPYRTLLDWYVDGCFLLQFLIVASAFLVKYVDDCLLLRQHAVGATNYLPVQVESAWSLSCALLVLNVSIWLSLFTWVCLKTYFVHTDVEHWMRIAEHINAGRSDAVTVSVREIQTLTQEAPQRGLFDFLRRKRGKKSVFLDFGGNKSGQSPQPGGPALKTSFSARSGSTKAL